MNRDLMFSSAIDTWCTPQDFFDKINLEFNFTLDVCATDKSAKCLNYFTPEIDGLKQDWQGNTVFCNPPYGRKMKDWVKKCYEESQKPYTDVVMLIPARTDTSYFHDYIQGKAIIRFIRGRLKFVNMESELYKSGQFNKMTPAPFPSMLVIYKSPQP